MKSHQPRPRPRRASRRTPAQQEQATAPPTRQASPERPRGDARTQVAPVLGLGKPGKARPGFAQAQVGGAEDEVVPAPGASGQGSPSFASAFAGGQSLTIQGRTDAAYDGGSFATQGVSAARAQGCQCTGSPCVHVTGTLTARYAVTTTVTLPSVADYPALSACQRQRVQTAIDTVLAPHEQQHVAAFRQYDGTTSRPFDLTLCRGEFDAAIRGMFQAEERARRQAAQSASDALDPFHFDVDLDCQDPPAAAPPALAPPPAPPPAAGGTGAPR